MSSLPDSSAVRFSQYVAFCVALYPPVFVDNLLVELVGPTSN